LISGVFDGLLKYFADFVGEIKFKSLPGKLAEFAILEI